MDKLVNISELCKILNLVDPKTKKPLNHIIRYWEKEFSQINPRKINDRRYYSSKDIEIISLIKILAKDKKISLAGIKDILSSNVKKLDEYDNNGLKKLSLSINIKNKSVKLIEKLKKLKSYGKKISYKSKNGS